MSHKKQKILFIRQISFCYLSNWGSVLFACCDSILTYALRLDGHMFGDTVCDDVA
jgi:hypothetical protein